MRWWKRMMWLMKKIRISKQTMLVVLLMWTSNLWPVLENNYLKICGKLGDQEEFDFTLALSMFFCGYISCLYGFFFCWAAFVYLFWVLWMAQPVGIIFGWYSSTLVMSLWYECKCVGAAPHYFVNSALNFENIYLFFIQR